MKTLERMCNVLNRLLEIDDAAAQQLFGHVTTCTPTAWASLLEDSEITIHVDDKGVYLTPLLLINSLVSEHRGDGEYAIFRDIDDHGRTSCFFVAQVKRGVPPAPAPEPAAAVAECVVCRGTDDVVLLVPENVHMCKRCRS